MKYSAFYLTQLTFIAFFSVYKTSWKLCFYAPGKPIGSYHKYIGHADVQPYSSFITESDEACNENCRMNDSCWATSFNEDSHNCSFYNTNKILVKRTTFGLLYSIWYVCNMTKGYQPDDGRCLGRWVTYPQQYINVDSYKNLSVIHHNLYSCQAECEGNSLCGFFNYINSFCLLVPKWPFENLNRTKHTRYNVNQWTCVDNYVETLEIPKKTFKPMNEKCTGYWEIVSRNDSSQGQDINGLFFQTQAFKDCLKECDQYAKCRVALFNVTYSICVLPNTSQGENWLPTPDTRFIKFEWKCDKNDSFNPQMNEEEKRYSSLGMKCRRIINNKDLYIGKDDCGKYPPEADFVRCRNTAFSSVFIGSNLKDSCQVNQSYWSFNEKILPLNLTGNEQMKVTKIFTGLAIYWLAYEDNNILGEVDYVECRSFNASRPKLKFQSSDIILKKNWQGENSNTSTPKIKAWVYIGISSLASSQYSCRTLNACMDILRTLQHRYFYDNLDIPFNFMINGNGDIYEYRGWNYQCGSVAAYYEVTLCIGYIGWFQNELPNERVVNGLKMFIEYAVVNGFVEQNYILFVQQNLGTSKVHKNLVNVVRNWYRYRGFTPENCKNYSLLNIGLCGLLILIVCVIIYAFFTRLEFRQFCDKCKFLDCQEIIFYQIYPHEIMLDTLDDDLTTYNCSTNYCIISKKSTVFAKANQSKTVKLIKLWFFIQFLKTINSRRHVNSLGNYLNSFPHLKGNSFVYEIKQETHKNESDYEKIILCVNNEKVFKEFQRLSKMKHCICNSFLLSPTDLTSVAIDIHVIK